MRQMPRKNFVKSLGKQRRATGFWLKPGVTDGRLKDPRVWTKAHELTLFVYEPTCTFPKEELLAKDLQFLTADEFHDLEGKVLEVQRMLASLVQRLQSPILARC